jgi:DHA1 family tetracycline resistance protein-like MFS transporter
MNSWRALAFIFCTVLLDVLALGLMILVLPRIVLGFMDGDTAGAAEMFGAFSTVWALMQFFFSPLLGVVSDRYGRRPVILVSCLGLGLDYAFMALAPSLALLFVGRIISGITSATIGTSYAYIADVTPSRTAPASSALSGPPSGWASSSGPRSAGCSAASMCACRCGPRPWPACSMPVSAGSCCPNRCRRKGAWRSPGSAPIRSARSDCLPGTGS